MTTIEFSSGNDLKQYQQSGEPLALKEVIIKGQHAVRIIQDKPTWTQLCSWATSIKLAAIASRGKIIIS